MTTTVTEIVKVVGPIALKGLAAAAEALIAGAAYDSTRFDRNLKLRALSDKFKSAGSEAGNMSTISTDTETFVTSNFATSFGYYYSGLMSQPTSGALPISALDDLVVWDPSEQGISDIQKYLQTIFKGSVQPGDSISISENLGEIFDERFKETSLQWEPLMKRYNRPDGLIIDTYMVTASVMADSGKKAGIARYAYVAYNSK
ncbi:hypothetical protein [uncultured Ruegeria sp.]|uniref:hypothetical protein n=1 Tax=uncultured Ruegeria sp. TaxID=259304 RepID=UPI00262170CA|nr:hypothetical protein [uncultured Ruegeria sp.]